MTDDLLDEATRLAGVAPPGSAAEHILATPRVLRALVERVQEAEAARDSWHQAALLTAADLGRVEHERDAARGKLDKVRALVTNPPAFTNREHGLSIYGHADLRDDLLAILDENEDV